MEKSTVYLTEDLQGAIKRIARRKRTSEAHVIREALATYVVAQETPMPKSAGCIDEPLEPGVDATNVKQWIRGNWIKDLDRERETKWLGPPDRTQR